MFNQEQQNDMYYQEMQESYQLSYDKERLAVYMAKVMGLMCVGLLVTIAAVLSALYVRPLLLFVYTQSGAIWGAYIILALVLSFGIGKMNAAVATVTFLAYSAVMGLFLTTFILMFQLSSIIFVLGLTSLTFLLMALYGYYTKKDLTSLGSLCLFALLGIIMANLLNMLIFKSVGLDLAVMCIGIIIFIGLIAYDAQKIKDMYIMAVTSGEAEESEIVKKIAIIGALNLYLDFINLFIRLLAIFGKRRN